MTNVHFQARYEWMTPRLQSAVGRVIIEWAGIDAGVTDICQNFWVDEHPQVTIPRPFDKRSKAIKDYGRKLYLEKLQERDEWRFFAWYIQRLRTLNDRRDDIAHGQPGLITKDGKQFEGLMVPRPSKETRFVEQTILDIEDLGQQLTAILGEATQVAYAFWAAHVAASPHRQAWRVQNGWTQITKENRSPKLSRWNVPPPTFRA
jgi:hypothetical protein